MANHHAARSLDKFYTRRVVARQCKEALFSIIDRPRSILEPSVGAGSFLEPGDGIVGFDLKPEIGGALQIDSLTPHLKEIMAKAEIPEFLSIGNPPFGERSRMAIDFVNQFVRIGGIVGFILPVSFRKWSVQSQIDPDARLILDRPVPEYAFEFPDGTPYGVRTCFQAWSKRACDHGLPDLRLRSKPPTAHPDFSMKRHNCTAATRSYLDEKWDMAVPAQGFVDYDTRVLRGGRCDPQCHWMMFSAEDRAVLERIGRIDFGRLSRRNTITPGFGKADVVEAYNALLLSEQ